MEIKDIIFQFEKKIKSNVDNFKKDISNHIQKEEISKQEFKKSLNNLKKFIQYVENGSEFYYYDERYENMSKEHKNLYEVEKANNQFFLENKVKMFIEDIMRNTFKFLMKTQSEDFATLCNKYLGNKKDRIVTFDADFHIKKIKNNNLNSDELGELWMEFVDKYEKLENKMIGMGLFLMRKMCKLDFGNL